MWEKIVFFVVFLCNFACLAYALKVTNSNHTETLHANDASADILWDTYGVPHIYGENEEVMTFAFGYAQAHLHGTALLSLFGRGRGKAAEYWGGEANLALDIYLWGNRIPSLAAEYYTLQDPHSVMLCESFAAGFNEYIYNHLDEVDESLLVVLPIDGVTVLQHGLHVLYLFTYVGADGMRTNFQEGYDVHEDPFYKEHATPFRHYSSFIDYDPFYEIPEEFRSQLGSNAWAVNSPKVYPGITSMLVANPHLPNLWFFRWTEGHLVCESEGIDILGVTLIGLPVLEIGFNKFLGWSHTVNVQRAYSGYELQLTAPGSSSYIFDDQILNITETENIIYEKLEDGSFVEHVVVVEYNVHGVINSRRGDRAIAIRLAGIDDSIRPDCLHQWYMMGRATNRDEFKAACSLNQAPMFTAMYADVDGNIGHYFFSFVANRTGMPGDYEYWGQPVDGTTSSLLWTTILNFEDIPYAENPPSGFLGNANEPPWTTTLPFYLDTVNPDNYPPWITAPPSMSTRSQTSTRLLHESINITFAKFEELKLSTFKENTNHCLNDFLDACNIYGDANALEGCSVLRYWDRNTESYSRGATLYNEWYADVTYVNSWSEEDPLGTPNTLADPQALVERLSVIVSEWKAAGRPLNEEYGSVYRYQNERLDGTYPGNGDSDTFRDSWFVLPASGNTTQQLYNGGDTIIYVIEFVLGGVPRARGSLCYGNASNRGHPHLNDQMPLASAKTLRPVFFSRADVENNLERRETVSFP